MSHRAALSVSDLGGDSSGSGICSLSAVADTGGIVFRGRGNWVAVDEREQADVQAVLCFVLRQPKRGQEY